MNRGGTHFAIQRRRFLAVCAAAALNARVAGQGSAQSTGRHFKLVKLFKNALYKAMSPDSRKLCILHTERPIGKFTLSISRKARAVKHEESSNSELKVFSMDFGTEMYSTRLTGFSGEFSFFLDGSAIYGSTSTVTLPIKDTEVRIDLRSGALQSLQEEYTHHRHAYFHALSDDLLIGINELGLFKVAWPDLKVPLHPPVPPGSAGSSFELSADGRALVHIQGQSLVYRRVDDLAVVWTREIDPRIDLAEQWRSNPLSPHTALAACAISADGSRVALAPWGGGEDGRPERFYLEILNGRNGSPIVRLALRPYEGIALSPDGRLLAIGRLDDSTPGALRPTVSIYAIPSAERAAVIVHDHVSPEHRLNASLSRGLEFTPDGKYLITSANNNVKIWQMP